MHGFILARRWSVEAEEGVKQLHTVLLHAKKTWLCTISCDDALQPKLQFTIVAGPVRSSFIDFTACRLPTKDQVRDKQWTTMPAEEEMEALAELACGVALPH